MKKNLLLLFIFSGFIGSAYADDNIETQSSQHEKIKLTEEEWLLLVGAIFPDHQQIYTETNQVLTTSCGWGVFARPESYDPSTYPHCAEVLTFLKRYKQQKAKLDKEADKLQHEIYKKRFEGISGTSQ